MILKHLCFIQQQTRDKISRFVLTRQLDSRILLCEANGIGGSLGSEGLPIRPTQPEKPPSQ